MIGDSAQSILDRRAAQAKANREAMPQTSEWLDATRRIFGDGVSIRYVHENGIERDKRIKGNVVSAWDIVLDRRNA